MKQRLPSAAPYFKQQQEAMLAGITVYPSAICRIYEIVTDRSISHARKLSLVTDALCWRSAREEIQANAQYQRYLLDHYLAAWETFEDPRIDSFIYLKYNLVNAENIVPFDIDVKTAVQLRDIAQFVTINNFKRGAVIGSLYQRQFYVIGYEADMVLAAIKYNPELIQRTVDCHSTAARNKIIRAHLSALKAKNRSPQFGEDDFDDLFLLHPVKGVPEPDPVVMLQFTLKAMKINGMALKYADPMYKENDEVCFNAVQQNENALDFVQLNAAWKATLQELGAVTLRHRMSKQVDSETESVVTEERSHTTTRSMIDTPEDDAFEEAASHKRVKIEEDTSVVVELQDEVVLSNMPENIEPIYCVGILFTNGFKSRGNEFVASMSESSAWKKVCEAELNANAPANSDEYKAYKAACGQMFDEQVPFEIRKSAWIEKRYKFAQCLNDEQFKSFHFGYVANLENGTIDIENNPDSFRVIYITWIEEVRDGEYVMPMNATGMVARIANDVEEYKRIFYELNEVEKEHGILDTKRKLPASKHVIYGVFCEMRRNGTPRVMSTDYSELYASSIFAPGNSVEAPIPEAATVQIREENKKNGIINKFFGLLTTLGLYGEDRQ